MRQRSSLWETSKRWCRPFSMPPKPARLNSSHFWASSFWGSALVMRQMFSSLRPSVWRSKRAACAASGKQTCSGATPWVRIERLTLWPFSYSKVRYSVGVGCQGGKIRLGGGQQGLDVLVQLELVVFNGQQIIPSALQHNIASRDRKSTRLNSSHLGISYAVFCLKKKRR